MVQSYKIANLTVQMDTFGTTLDRAKPYLCPDAAPDVVITSNRDALNTLQPHLSADACEYLCTGSSFYRQLLSFDGMLLHASAVVVDDRAYLFSAPSGTGKSTHTRLWLELLGERAYLLNDDKPALRREGGIWYAWGTPWSGKDDISRNTQVPLAGICFLHRAQENSIAPFHGSDAIHALLEQTVRPGSPGLTMQLMRLLDSLLTSVPVWQMGCNISPEAAMMAYTAMSGKNKEEFHED